MTGGNGGKQNSTFDDGGLCLARTMDASAVASRSNFAPLRLHPLEQFPGDFVVVVVVVGSGEGGCTVK